MGPVGANVLSVIRMFGQPVGDEGIVSLDEVRIESCALVRTHRR